MRYALAWLVSLALTICCVAQADLPTPTPRQLTVATYNVKHMLDVFDDPYSHDERAPVKPASEIEKIAQAIRALDADIVALQEVEQQGMLKLFVHDMLGDMGYRHIVVTPTNSGHGGNLGVISRLPIVSLTSHREMDLTLPGQPKRWRFARDLLQVRFTMPDSRQLDVFVVHFKHGAKPRSTLWRQAEAHATRRVIENHMAQHPDAWVLLIGDLNDQPKSPTLTHLLATDPTGQPLLMDLHAHLPKDQRVTFLHPPYRRTIDYILASPALGGRVLAASARVLTDNDVPTPNGLAGSDHAPVAVTFEIGQP